MLRDWGRVGMSALLLVFSAVYLSALQFDETFFPNLEETREEDVYLRGIAQLYPGRVLFEAPALIARSERTEAAKIENLPRDVKYVRIYRLEEAIPVIREVIAHPALVLDFRYLKSPSSGSALHALMSRRTAETTLTLIGDAPDHIREELAQAERGTVNRAHPAIILSNRETAGPFEAVLAGLQTEGSIIAVGENTAGRTGFYDHIRPQTWVLCGELRPAPQISLIPGGFAPRIHVKLSPETDYRSYHLYEAGTQLEQLIRQETRTLPVSKDNGESSAVSVQTDQVLQRGIEIVAALQVLQELPDS